MRPLSLLFIDLDNFKQINDAYGHTMGDQVLREVGWLLDSQQAPGRGTARASDFSARYGGEEFALILPDTSMDGALSAAERLRHRVTTLTMLPELTGLNTHPLALTCSIGVATFPIHASIPSDLVVAADAAVYAAKTAGKNCVRLASPANPARAALRSPCRFVKPRDTIRACDSMSRTDPLSDLATSDLLYRCSSIRDALIEAGLFAPQPVSSFLTAPDLDSASASWRIGLEPFPLSREQLAVFSGAGTAAPVFLSGREPPLYGKR